MKVSRSRHSKRSLFPRPVNMSVHVPSLVASQGLDLIRREEPGVRHFFLIADS
jgi:hypothetical protein